jgi:hypothetical protein
MPMAQRSVSRATAPHLPTLNTTLTPLLAVAGAGGFHTRYDGAHVVIEQGTFAGVNTAAVDAAVAAAPVATDELDAQCWVDAMPITDKAVLLTLLDEINTIRTNPALGLAARAVPQAIGAVRTKAGTL